MDDKIENPARIGMLMAIGRLGKPVYGGSKRGKKDTALVKTQKASRKINRNK